MTTRKNVVFKLHDHHLCFAYNSKVEDGIVFAKFFSNIDLPMYDRPLIVENTEMWGNSFIKDYFGGILDYNEALETLDLTGVDIHVQQVCWFNDMSAKYSAAVFVYRYKSENGEEISGVGITSVCLADGLNGDEAILAATKTKTSFKFLDEFGTRFGGLN